MRLPDHLPDPIQLQQRHQGFAGPFAIGPMHLRQMLPSLDKQAVELYLPAHPPDGSVSPRELSWLAHMAQWGQPQKVLEIGTFQGLTTHNLALQLSQDSEVITVDLPEDQEPVLQKDNWNRRYYPDPDRKSYLERPTPAAIHQIRGDTAQLTVQDLGEGYDMIFIDGSHSLPYVRNDTQLALDVAAPKALILWHDYGRIPHWPGVTTVLHGVAREGLRPIYWLHEPSKHLDTSLAMYWHGHPSSAVP